MGGINSRFAGWRRGDGNRDDSLSPPVVGQRNSDQAGDFHSFPIPVSHQRPRSAFPWRCRWYVALLGA